MSQHTGIPPNKPNNPFPPPRNHTTTDIFITPEAWEEFLTEFLEQHPGYHLDNWDPQNATPFRHKLHKVWKEVRFVQSTIMVPRDAHAKNYKEKLRRLVAGTKTTIGNAVCLALGHAYAGEKALHLDSTKNERNWIEQCGMFLALCQMIEEKHKLPRDSLPKVFQDPAFNLEDRFVLEQLGQQTVLPSPGAVEHITRRTFVFAPHFPADHLFGTIFGRGDDKIPEILLTQDLGGDYAGFGAAIAQRHIQKAYWTGNQTIDSETRKMYEEGKRFLKSHHKLEFDYLYPSPGDPLRQVLEHHSFNGMVWFERKSWMMPRAIESS
ncbi:hypothetical protein D6C85_08958 [Aureobasidium pullulans]|uniref:SRR1-like domain-containing protein n=1 Tax=Aureobasidium pullulans TaxID=5580 RepID=A0A4S9WDY0_AURPU|nr:hypothetical protein D6C85_08958 [Aureobasidium pullulans]